MLLLAISGCVMGAAGLGTSVVLYRRMRTERLAHQTELAVLGFAGMSEKLQHIIDAYNQHTHPTTVGPSGPPA